MQDILLKVRQELAENKGFGGIDKFFKQEIKKRGVKTAIVRKIAKNYFPKKCSKKEVFSLCENLLSSGYSEEATIAFQWVLRMKNQFSKDDFNIFEKWLKKYIDNWAKCDDFMTHAFSELLFQFPELINKVKKWINSKNRWQRRASAVVFIPLISKEKKYLKHVFEIALKLLKDKDDMVQKGYGWLLKEASRDFQKDVFQFVMGHKKEMPRTALRYAIEKMPVSLKRRAMS